jgi:hypothetical protein
VSPVAASATQSLGPQQAAAANLQFGISAPATMTVGETAAVADTGGAARAAAVLALQSAQDAKDAQPVSHMTLQLDNGDGGLDRIRVGLRGTTVSATIDIRDPAAATDAAGNIQQLATALQARGLDPDSLNVRVAATVGTTPTADLSRVLAASGDSTAPPAGTLFAQASSSSSSSRGDAQGQRPQQDPSRQRTRKDQQGEQQ